MVAQVSILSQPEGRELHTREAAVAEAAAFQSSPSPKAGSYGPILPSGLVLRCFNPLPARRPGATYLFHAVFVVFKFQSSPSPKAGSYVELGG